jgi:hypothetical protein
MNKNIGIKFSILVFSLTSVSTVIVIALKNSNLDSLSSINVIVVSLSVTIKILKNKNIAEEILYDLYIQNKI